MKQLLLIDANTPDMAYILDMFERWGGSIHDMALENNVKIPGWSKRRQDKAIQDCIENGLIRRDPDDWERIWHLPSVPTWAEFFGGPKCEQQ